MDGVSGWLMGWFWIREIRLQPQDGAHSWGPYRCGCQPQGETTTLGYTPWFILHSLHNGNCAPLLLVYNKFHHGAVARLFQSHSWSLLVCIVRSLSCFYISSASQCSFVKHRGRQEWTWNKQLHWSLETWHYINMSGICVHELIRSYNEQCDFTSSH